ncbi:MAG: glutamate-1-semialdehyde 2,1-aminomutase [Chloroflexota bacterium]
MTSRELYQRARAVMPGGVSSPVRAYQAVGGEPPFIERGDGPWIWDVDGNRYLDYVLSWGPLINGHAYAPAVRAIEEQVPYGTSFGAPTQSELQLAETLVEAVQSLEMVRFVSSGTEAAMSAIRLARAATGRDLIVKFAGNYHGHSDSLLAKAGSGALTLGIPSTPGTPPGTTRDTLVVEYNDAPGQAELFDRYQGQIAAVIVEPVAGNMGVVKPEPDFLDVLRSLRARHATLLIADEVITGFRLARGGAQSVYRLRPDLTTLGKIIGGGLPVGAYGGRRDLMEQVAPLGPVYQAGTLSGNPLAMQAGLANLQPLDDALYQRLAQLTDRLASGLLDGAKEAGVPVTVNAVTGMLTVFFTEQPVRDLHSAQTSDTGRYANFFQQMLRSGYYLPPSQFEAWMLSAAHDENLIDQTIQAARAAFRAAATPAAKP